MGFPVQRIGKEGFFVKGWESVKEMGGVMASEHLTRLLRALTKRPDLFMEVKEAMVNALVAGPWVFFNDTKYARQHRVQLPKKTLVRFTPSSDGEKIVALVQRRLLGPRPDWAAEDSEMYADWKEERLSIEETPWKGFVSREEQQMVGFRGSPPTEYTKTPEEAMVWVDRYLEKTGWILIDSSADQALPSIRSKIVSYKEQEEGRSRTYAIAHTRFLEGPVIKNEG